MKNLAFAVSFALTASVLLAATAQDRLTESAEAFSEVMRAPDKGIPQDLLAKARCIVIIPSLKKAAFVVGGEFGKGFAECRNPGGMGWGAPAAVRMEGGSVGLQIGGSSTDLILLVMSQRGMDKLLEDKFTLGADASVAGGPVGRTADAATDLQMHAEILAWSRSRGLFAGVALNGGTLRNDLDANEELYGKKMTDREIILGHMTPPAAAHRLIGDLDRYSMRAQGTSDRAVH